MQNVIKLIIIFVAAILISCGGKEEKKDDNIKLSSNKTETKKSPDKNEAASVHFDLTNKGIGPIKELKIPKDIDQAMAQAGEETFKLLCMACHKPTKKFIGPALSGIMERRSPEWIMNMILNPEEMTENDPIAKALFIEYNGSLMLNQGLTEEEARSILEYFRTIKSEDE